MVTLGLFRDGTVQGCTHTLLLLLGGPTHLPRLDEVEGADN